MNNEEMEIEFPVLEKHKYPLWVRIFGLATVLVFLYVVPCFLLSELPLHRALNLKIKTAERLFLKKNYVEALTLYEEIITEHPTFKEGKMHAAQACFALSGEYENRYLYEIGFEFLLNASYSRSEIAQMKKFVPKEYHEDFESQFTKEG